MSLKALSVDFIAAAAAERDRLAQQLTGVRERIEHLEAQASEAREEAESLSSSIRAIEEMVGLSPHIAQSGEKRWG